MKVMLTLTLLLCGLMLTSVDVVAQDYVLEWNYEAGSYFGQLSMSPNAQYIAVQVYYVPKNNPNAWHHEVHLLNANGTPLWKFKWEPPDDVIWGVAVANNGNVGVLSAAEPFNMAWRGKDNPAVVYLISKSGNVLLRKQYGDNITLFSGLSISPDANYLFFTANRGELLLLLDRNGKQVWNDKKEGADFKGPMVTQGGFIFSNGTTHKMHVWNAVDEKWWTAVIPYDDLCRISPDGQWIAVVVKDALSDFVSNCETAGDIALYDLKGRKVKTAGGTCTITDFALTNNKLVITVNGDKTASDFYVQRFDFNQADVQTVNIFYFDTPSGKHGGGAPQVEVSEYGKKVVVSTPYTIYCLKEKQLDKKW